jgi:hypothetical protein
VKFGLLSLLFSIFDSLSRNNSSSSTLCPMKKIYWRCNSGHYFSSSHCPLDGWSRPYISNLIEAVSALDSEEREVSIEHLKTMGFSDDVLRRVIVIEFGSADSSFEGFMPEGYFLNGHYVALNKVGSDLL